MIDLAPPPAREPLVIRHVHADDVDYCAKKWGEDYKNAAGNRKLNWSAYKRAIAPDLRRVLALPSTEILGAYRGASLIGWIAFAPGRKVSTIHWVRTRSALGRDGESERRRGVMSQLFDAARLGALLLYTHRGPKLGGEPSDQMITRWLASRGQVAAFQSLQEWER